MNKNKQTICRKNKKFVPLTAAKEAASVHRVSLPLPKHTHRTKTSTYPIQTHIHVNSLLQRARNTDNQRHIYSRGQWTFFSFTYVAQYYKDTTYETLSLPLPTPNSSFFYSCSHQSIVISFRSFARFNSFQSHQNTLFMTNKTLQQNPFLIRLACSLMCSSMKRYFKDFSNVYGNTGISIPVGKRPQKLNETNTRREEKIVRDFKGFCILFQLILLLFSFWGNRKFNIKLKYFQLFCRKQYYT